MPVVGAVPLELPRPQELSTVPGSEPSVRYSTLLVELGPSIVARRRRGERGSGRRGRAQDLDLVERFELLV